MKDVADRVVLSKDENEEPSQRGKVHACGNLPTGELVKEETWAGKPDLFTHFLKKLIQMGLLEGKKCVGLWFSHCVWVVWQDPGLLLFRSR